MVKYGAVLAGGGGSRIADLSQGRGKAMLPVGGCPLIDHALNEFARTGVEAVVVVVRPTDDTLMDYLRRHRRFSSIEMITCNPDDGTLASVRALSNRLAGHEFLLSTCDVIARPGTFLRLTDPRVTEGSLAVVLTSEYVHGNDPVWVHVDDSDVVINFGKNIAPSKHVFGHVRWLSASFHEALEQTDLKNCTRDTLMMGKVAATFPGKIRAIDGGAVMDVDTPEDLAEAHLMLESFVDEL